MTTVEFLHSKGLNKWKNLQVTTEDNKIIFLKELLEEYHEMKQKLLQHSVCGPGSDVRSEGEQLGNEGAATKPAGGYCECEFVMIMRNQETQIGYCAQCEKEVNEQ